MKKLNLKDVDDLLAGNSWFATGGGFPAQRAREIFTRILKRDKLILKSLNEFKENDYLCVASGVGSIKHTDVDITRNSSRGIVILEKIIGHRIKGIVSGEIGLECLAADTATKLGLPLVNTDMKGGRAAPEPSINMFNLVNQSVLPAVAINTDGDTSILKDISEPKKIEIFLRHFSNMASGCFVAWCPRQAKLYRKLLIEGTITNTIKLGGNIKRINILEKILKKINGKKIFEGKITKIEDEEIKGFLIRKVTVKNGGNISQVFIKNENLAITVNNKVAVTCPDLITIINPKTNFGVHNSTLITGQEVIIIAISHHRKWHSRRGQSIFGPKHFSLPFNIKKL